MTMQPSDRERLSMFRFIIIIFSAANTHTFASKKMAGAERKHALDDCDEGWNILNF
jgi:hypothetical protein